MLIPNCHLHIALSRKTNAQILRIFQKAVLFRNSGTFENFKECHPRCVCN